MENKKIDVVSIIIPVYNVEKYIKRCLDSVIKQTYKDIEIILVDDGSTDSSGSICDYYASIDARVKVVHQENGGISAARNRGLDICTGNYITFADSDDWIEENTIEQMLKLLQEHNSDMVMCEFYYNKENEVIKKTVNTRLANEHRYTKEEIVRDIFPICCCRDVVDGKNMPPLMDVWNKLFTRQLALKFRFNSKMTHSEDVYYVIECLMECNAIYYSSQSYYHYICLENTASHKYNVSTFESKRILNHLLYQYICKYKNKDKKLYDVFFHKCILDMLTVCYRGFSGGVSGGYPCVKKYILFYMDDEVNRKAIAYYSDNDKKCKRRIELFLLRKEWIGGIFIIHLVKKLYRKLHKKK